MVNYVRQISIISLTGLSAGPRPFEVVLNCHSWHLRVSAYNSATASLDGTLLNDLAGADFFGSLAVDFPPIFDGRGEPVPYMQKLHFNPGDSIIIGSIIQAYFVPGIPSRGA